VAVEISFVHPQFVDNSVEFELMVKRMKSYVANHVEQTAIPGQHIERMLILESELCL
jgi:hypothetical protein